MNKSRTFKTFIILLDFIRKDTCVQSKKLEFYQLKYEDLLCRNNRWVPHNKSTSKFIHGLYVWSEESNSFLQPNSWMKLEARTWKQVPVSAFYNLVLNVPVTRYTQVLFHSCPLTKAHISVFNKRIKLYAKHALILHRLKPALTVPKLPFYNSQLFD